tara:strand:- start:209 stop:373 length:165 start_codon:yes stop_codon:yes gene_type:complete
MATVYKIKIKTVSAFVNYNEAQITEIIEKLLKNYKDKQTGLGFEATEIDVERVS